MSEVVDVNEQLFAKLREFVAGLDDEERNVFAALIGPGVAAAYRDPDEVEAYTLSWEPTRLPDHLAAAIRAKALRIVGL